MSDEEEHEVEEEQRGRGIADGILIPAGTLPMGSSTPYEPPPISAAEDAEQWEQAEAAHRAWREAGYTLADFLEAFDHHRAAHDLYSQMFILPGGAGPEPCRRGWERVYAVAYRKRYMLRNLLNRGYWPQDAVAAVGLDKPADRQALKAEITERDEIIAKRDQTIAAGTVENAQQRRKIEELESENQKQGAEIRRLSEALAEWESRADDPQRTGRGLFR